MEIWIGLVVLLLLTVFSYLRGVWPLAAVGWGLLGVGALIGADGRGSYLIIGGAVLILLGGTKAAPFMRKNRDEETDDDLPRYDLRWWGS